jgi:electron transport complex protein RnfG
MARWDWKAHWVVPVAALVHPTFAADFLNVSEAQKLLFPSADEFVKKPIELRQDQLDAIKELSGVRQRTSKPQVWLAYHGKKPLGVFIVDEVIGKHEYITYAAALAPDNKVLGIEIMTYRETKGCEVREADWRAHFKGKSLNDRFKLDEDVPNISGATLSCRNLLDGVKRLLALQKVIGDV